MFFANAGGALLGIFVSKQLLPLIGYHGVFIFYGVLTLLSAVMMVAFREVSNKPKAKEEEEPIYPNEDS